MTQRTYQHTPAGIIRVGCMVHEDCLQHTELGLACEPVEPYEGHRLGVRSIDYASGHAEQVVQIGGDYQHLFAGHLTSG